MSSALIIRHCAPTLAGMKVGNLFSYHFQSKESLFDALEKHNALLNAKGIFFILLRLSETSALVYVYRRRTLEKRLQETDIQAFLKRYGYADMSLWACFQVLKAHLQEKDFPHEIGVFLGYPLGDIQAFIQNGGKGYKCVGQWKVYYNEEDAKKTFAKYTKCTQIYCQKHAQGLDMHRLTVNG